MTNTLIDANYVLRWFLGDVPGQSEIVQTLLSNAPEQSITVDRLSLAEVTYVLRSKGYDNQQIATVIREFACYPSVQEFSAVLQKTLDIYATTKLDFEDCFIIAKANADKLTIGSFDKQLLKTAKR